jgi:CheY-like chemotaxis protein
MNLLSFIYFIVCHVGPAEHFVEISKQVEKEGEEVRFYASGPALKKLEEQNINTVIPFDAESFSDETVEYLVKECSNAEVIITDMGHSFNEMLLKSLSEKGLESIGYYDNRESYVPGGYSEKTAKSMRYASKVLFANANLASSPIYECPSLEIDYPHIKRIGLGYYPLKHAQKIADLRETEHTKMRSQFLIVNNFSDQGEKVVVYFGGNNSEYYEKAFPVFLEILSKSIELEDLSKTVLVLQQHPGAKGKNVDGFMLEDWVKNKGTKQAPKFLISNLSSEDMLLVADGALYYQTSMGPLFCWAGIPTIQVGHQVNEDFLVRAGLCSTATNAQDFLQSLLHIKEEPLTLEKKESILSSLGINEDWFSVFTRSILSL